MEIISAEPSNTAILWSQLTPFDSQNTKGNDNKSEDISMRNHEIDWSSIQRLSLPERSLEALWKIDWETFVSENWQQLGST